MKIVVDAINIKSEGGLTYLNQFLSNINKNNINEICVLISKKSLITSRHKKIKIIDNKIFNQNFIKTNIWKILYLNKFLRKINCQKLIVMSGHYMGFFNPTFLVIQNALPFSNETRKYFPFVLNAKFYLQKISHLISIKMNNNIIFVSHSIKKKVLKNFSTKKNYIVSCNAVTDKIIERKKRKKIKKSILKLIYVSQYANHKNHIKLLDAIKTINKNRIQVTLDCYGQDLDDNLVKFKKFIKLNNIKGIKLKKSVDQNNLFKIYRKYDCHIFPSYCESFGLPLLESARAGLLILCSNLGVFHEILKDSPVYFNQNSKRDIRSSILKIVDMSNLQFYKKINKSIIYSNMYKWKPEVKKVKEFMLS